MRFNLALAFLVSLLLIGSASWSRFANHQKVESELMAVDTQRQKDKEYFEDVVLPVLEKSATSSISTPEKLTTADLVGRQLIIDYVELVSQGSVSEKDVLDLAERYVESIPTLNSAPTISYSDLKLAPNDKASLQRYADEMTRTYNAHVSAMSRAELEMVGSNPDYYSFAAAASGVYAQTAEKLKAVKVPGAAAQAHLGLTNSYLANSSNLKAVSKADEDSASAFAALLSVSENAEEERHWVEQLTLILNSHGI